MIPTLSSRSKAKLLKDKMLETVGKIEKKGFIESEKTLIEKTSTSHRIHIVFAYPVYILRYFTRATEVDAKTKVNDLEKGIILFSASTVADFDEKTREKAS